MEKKFHLQSQWSCVKIRNLSEQAWTSETYYSSLSGPTSILSKFDTGWLTLHRPWIYTGGTPQPLGYPYMMHTGVLAVQVPTRRLVYLCESYWQLEMPAEKRQIERHVLRFNPPSLREIIIILQSINEFWNQLFLGKSKITRPTKHGANQPKYS